MATYVIGDIQGCYKTLKRLLKQIQFQERSDNLILLGDLVNRGPQSLDVLRFAKDLDKRVVSVMGNHEIHLLAYAEGIVNGKSKKMLSPILEAKDSDKLLAWVRKRPFLYQQGRLVFVHAGLLPAWTLRQALDCGQELEKIIQSKKCKEFLQFCYKKPLTLWEEGLEGYTRYATALNILTRIRMCKSETQIELDFTDPPEKAPPDLTPWFSFLSRKTKNSTIVFGHWAALGVRQMHNCISLDSGCVWGGALSALRVDDGAITSVGAVE